MIFQEFRKMFYEMGCFSSAQVRTWQPGIDKNNLGRWVKKGLLIKLRQGWYTFPEYLGKAGFDLYLSNKIYKPSYVSLHSALAFYGLIPEAVVQITGITTLKTKEFTNSFGTFSYQSVKSRLFFGYEPKSFAGDRSLLIASAEKALLDLLYLYPFYNTREDMEALRLDEDLMHESVSSNIIKDYTARFRNNELEKRVKNLMKTYMS